HAVARVGAGAPRLRLFDTRDQVAHDLFGDVEETLELEHGGAGGVELDDEIRAFALLTDGICQAPTAPRADLNDLPFCSGNRARHAVDHGLDLVIRRVGAQDQHQL